MIMGKKKLTEEKYTINRYKRIVFYMVMVMLLLAFLLGLRMTLWKNPVSRYVLLCSDSSSNRTARTVSVL